MKTRSPYLAILALCANLAIAASAHADDLMLRIRQTAVGAAPQYEVLHAQSGSFAHQPPLAEQREGDLLLIGRDAQGAELFRRSVRSPTEHNNESFDPHTGAIVAAHKSTGAAGVVEVRMPYPKALQSIDLLPQHVGAPGAAALANPAPTRRLLRQELDALLAAPPQASAAPAAGGKLKMGAALAPAAKAAIVPTGSAMLWQTGPSNSRMDIVLIGDGYAAADQAKWRSDAQTVVNGILADPLFYSYRGFLNIRRVDIVSPDSGVSENFGAIARNTALGTVVGCYGLDRLVCADPNLVVNAVAAVAPVDGRDLTVLVANSVTYGGSGAPTFAALTMHPQSIQIALHEIGHTAFQLADEYDVGTCATTTEPSEADVTIQTQRASVKWNGLIGASTPVPTQAGVYANGTVGLFVGGKYCPNSVYRPTENSRMRTLGQPWHAVNERRADGVFRFYDPGVTIYGSLNGVGAIAYQPGAAVNSAAGGAFTLTVWGPTNSQFDLMLLKWNGSAYAVVAQNTDSTSAKTVSYQGTAGYYLVEIRARVGSGAYTLNYNFPN